MRGPKVPSFFDTNMITEKQLTALVTEHLEGTPFFVVDVSIRSGNRICVYIDGDQGVNIDDCKAVNRFIESSLDRETEDYDLTVSTPGANSPLRFPRQYPKHTGRELEIITTDDTAINGILVRADAEGIELEHPKKSKKEEQKPNTLLPFNQIKEAKIKLSFK